MNECFFTTYSGEKVNIMHPSPDQINIEDIAHSLSLICRYNGHCNKFYSVAEHSVHVSCLAKSSLWGLLHDAPEAYFSDIPRPIKAQFPQIDKYEQRILDAVKKKFHIWGDLPKNVKEVDDRILVNEIEVLMPNQDASELKWSRYKNLDLSGQRWTPKQAEEKFLKRYYEVIGEKNEIRGENRELVRAKLEKNI